MIFVWHHAEGADPDWYPESRENIESGKWIYRGRNEFLINSHIQVRDILLRYTIFILVLGAKLIVKR